MVGPRKAREVITDAVTTAKPRFRKTLALIGSTAALGAAAPAVAAAPAGRQTPQRAVERTAESFAVQVVSDYEHAKPKERRMFRGLHGVEVLAIKYPAKNLIDRRAGEYVLQAAFSRDVKGHPTPNDINSVTIDEYSGSDDVYSFEAAPIDNHRHWAFILNILDKAGIHHYDYTTGTPHPQESWFPLTMQAFNPIAHQAQTILSNARRHVPISAPELPPFPPPEYQPPAPG